MKKIICLMLLLALCMPFCACTCEHQWNTATCTTPKTCTLCGEHQGSVASHTWQAATCTTPKTCSVCGEHQGSVASHTWQAATCTTPKTCSVCSKTEGDVSSVHAFENSKCKHCNAVQLTLSNYEDYIECSASVRVGDSLYYSSSVGYVYTSAECSFEAVGNSHYKYSDVSIVIKFTHYDKAGYQQYLMNSISAIMGNPITEEAVPYDDETYTVKLSLAGNGSKTCELRTPWSQEISAYSDTEAIFDRTLYEIVSISGTVEEY